MPYSGGLLLLPGSILLKIGVFSYGETQGATLRREMSELGVL